MEIQFLVTLDFDPQTNEFKIVKQEQNKEKIKKTSNKKITVEETGEGIVILEDNKICLNQCAAQLLKVEPDDRIAVQYNKIGNRMIPLIGSIESFGITSGNKLTKGLTVSFRGNANVELSKYGTRFTLEEIKGKQNVYILIGETEISTSENSEDDNIITISDLAEKDLPLDTNLDILDEDIILDENTIDLIDPSTFKL
jgi:hypothetical protein